MAPATLEISIFSGNRLKIPPGAAFGGAPGKGYFQPKGDVAADRPRTILVQTKEMSRVAEAIFPKSRCR